MTTVDKIIDRYKTCPQCGVALGTIVEIERGGIRIRVLQSGNQYILDERALCTNCLMPIYWNTSLHNLQKLIKAITGWDIPTEELDKPNAPETP